MEEKTEKSYSVVQIGVDLKQSKVNKLTNDEENSALDLFQNRSDKTMPTSFIKTNLALGFAICIDGS